MLSKKERLFVTAIQSDPELGDTIAKATCELLEAVTKLRGLLTTRRWERLASLAIHHRMKNIWFPEMPE